ncbi:hypothetical protein ANN_12775 [Periplaneta americana]|uniref:Uncharacterized protein n=1 Tax=Periplaneta americana TaxID=6978 RepID=A0ABQ8THH5_PERAM|nr:hypothetical protein ANN_12775 [Periplaneta americana]
MGNACYYSVEKLLSSSLLSKNLKVRIYKTVILPVLLYGCETWTLTLREEHRFRVFENKVLRKIFGAKRDEVTGEWRKLHNTELHALYSSPDIIRNIKSRRLRWAGHVARMGESRNAYRVLVGRPEGKGPLGRPRRRWEDNIKMDLREVGYDDRGWINLAQDRDRWRGLCEGGNEPSGSLKAIYEVRSEDSPKDYPAFAFCLGKTSEKPNQEILNPPHFAPMSDAKLTTEIATGVAQSVKALGCRSEVTFGRGAYGKRRRPRASTDEAKKMRERREFSHNIHSQGRLSSIGGIGDNIRQLDCCE